MGSLVTWWERGESSRTAQTSYTNPILHLQSELNFMQSSKQLKMKNSHKNKETKKKGKKVQVKIENWKGRKNTTIQ